MRPVSEGETVSEEVADLSRGLSPVLAHVKWTVEENGDPLGRHMKNQNVAKRMARAFTVHAQDVREVGLPECELGLNRTNSGGSRLARTTAV